jgi:FemAB-related protein (PEP-CTERM system-associated)
MFLGQREISWHNNGRQERDPEPEGFPASVWSPKCTIVSLMLSSEVSPQEGARQDWLPTSIPVAASGLTIGRQSAGEDAGWDEFVSQHPHSSPFHLMAWKRTIEESFGYEPFYLKAEQAGRIRGILPLFLVRNFIVKKALISTPFAVYGGILAESEEVRRALHEHAVKVGRELGVEYIELRNAYPEQCVAGCNVDRYVAFSQALVPTEAELMEGLPKKTRNLVRKSLKQPFEMVRGIRDAKVFDRLHSRNMRRLGTPNFPRRYFERLLANFGDRADIREVRLNGQVMAAGLNIYYRGDMHTYHAAADTQYNALGPNTFMYFDHLRWAGENGYTSFDFGRCKRGTGVFEFKKHWNTTMRELPYEIVLVKRKDLPNFSPTNPRFHLAIKIWQKLPLFVTRTVSRFVFALFP